MKILIIGSKGQLGSELIKRCRQEHIGHISFDIPEFDISDRNLVNEVITNEKPAIVINSSAYTAVDKAENDIETAYKVNRDGPSHLSEICSKQKIPLIHISTDYVFDGKSKEPYKENSDISPLGIYGKSKADGEKEIRLNLKEHVIIRTAWLCGVHGNNFVKTMFKLGKEREELSVVSDQYGCPTFAGDLAKAVLDISKKIACENNSDWGTYHYCGKGVTSWYDFACKIFKIAEEKQKFKLKKLIPITTDQYPTPAKRPKYSALDCTNIKEKFSVEQKEWETGLKEMIEELYKD